MQGSWYVALDLERGIIYRLPLLSFPLKPKTNVGNYNTASGWFGDEISFVFDSEERMNVKQK